MSLMGGRSGGEENSALGGGWGGRSEGGRGHSKGDSLMHYTWGRCCETIRRGFQ